MLLGADLIALGSRSRPAGSTCQPCGRAPEDVLSRAIFLVEKYKTERCKLDKCPCRRACVFFHDYADRRSPGWPDWQLRRPGREENKPSECYSPKNLWTQACKREAEGNCPFGENCSFAHVLSGMPLLPRHSQPLTREQWIGEARRAIDAHFASRSAVAGGEGGWFPNREATRQSLEISEYEMTALVLFPCLAAALARDCELSRTRLSLEKGPGKRGAVVVSPRAGATNTCVSRALLSIGKKLLALGDNYEFNKKFPHTGTQQARENLRLHLLTHGQSGFGWSSQHVRVLLSEDSQVHLRILKQTPAHSRVAAVVRRLLAGAD